MSATNTRVATFLAYLLSALLGIAGIILFAYRLPSPAATADTSITEVADASTLPAPAVQKSTSYTNTELATLFRDAPVPVAQQVVQPAPEKPVTDGPLIFIGVVDYSGASPTYYFKDTDTGEMIKAGRNDTSATLNIVSMNDGIYIVRYKEKLYEVHK